MAVVFFLSASVDLAFITYGTGEINKLMSGQPALPILQLPGVQLDEYLKIYRLYISAVVRKTHTFIVQNVKGY